MHKHFPLQNLLAMKIPFYGELGEFRAILQLLAFYLYLTSPCVEIMLGFWVQCLNNHTFLLDNEKRKLSKYFIGILC